MAARRFLHTAWAIVSRIKAAAAYTRIVKDYPLSDHADEATDKLKDMNRPVPEADPVAYARMKYEMENREEEQIEPRAGRVQAQPGYARWRRNPGTPAMAAIRPTVPLSVPAALHCIGALRRRSIGRHRYRL